VNQDELRPDEFRGFMDMTSKLQCWTVIPENKKELTIKTFQFKTECMLW
jgi:hypothetical protein